jgi:formate hydrogenlyase transcriptional activator
MTESEADLRKELEERLRFETLLGDLSTGFVGLSADQVDGAIEDAQRRIVDTLALDRSTLFQYSEESKEVILTHFWVRPGLLPHPRGLSAKEWYPWAFEKVVMQREIIRFSSVNDLPPEAARDAETIRKYGPKSNVSFPLVAGGKVFAGLAFGTMREERAWNDDLVARLRLVADIFANTLARKRSGVLGVFARGSFRRVGAGSSAGGFVRQERGSSRVVSSLEVTREADAACVAEPEIPEG